MITVLFEVVGLDRILIHGNKYCHFHCRIFPVENVHAIFICVEVVYLESNTEKI